MRWAAEVVERLRSLLFRGREEAELDEELRFHLDMETERLRREQRLTWSEARRRAAVALGGRDRIREEVRDARGTRLILDGCRDLRLSVRRLAREPSFTAPAAVTLGIGIGAAAGIFALVHVVLLRPLPYPGAERLVAIGHVAPGFGVEAGGISDGLFLHYREHNRVFDAIGVYHENEQNLTDGETPERVRLAMASPGVFAALGVKPQLGRLFTAADAESDGLSGVLISHELWMRRYGRDPAIVGGTIETNGSTRPVIGVMPPGLDFPSPETQIWYPSGPEAERADLRDLYRSGIGRLRAGVTAHEAEAELLRLLRTLPRAYPEVTPELLREIGFRPVVAPLHDVMVGHVRPALVLLLCAAGLVLVIAWANAANLVLLRSERQRPEVVLSRALGARGRDLARRFLGESMVLALMAGSIALLIGYAGVTTRFGFQTDQIPRLHELAVDGVLIAIVAGLSCVAGLLLGLVPLMRTRKLAGAEASGSGTGRATEGRGVRRAQRTLVSVQVALALALLIGSAAMARSVWNLLRVDVGFDPRDVLTLELPLAFRQYPRYADAVAVQLELLERLRALPGVVAAEATLNLPLTPTPFVSVPLTAAGEEDSGVPPAGIVNFATPGFFAAIGIPVSRGRGFRSDDLNPDVPPVIVSESLARALFGDRDPLGRRVRLAERPSDPSYTVVGVVGDVAGEKLAAGPARTLYFPIVRDPHAADRRNPPISFIPREGATLVIRTSVPPLSIAPSVRRVVREVDPELPLSQLRTLSEIVASATAPARLTTLLLLIGSAAALLLGVVGIYGAMAYWVGRHQRELGVRLALGARPGDLTGMVVRQGLRVVLPGIAAGLIVALGMTRLLRGLLFGISPTDPVIFAATPALLFAIALSAVLLPAHRATRIDPAETLRSVQ